MGCWGTHWQESDTYLNIYNRALEPIKQILNKKHSDDCVKKGEAVIVSASGFLLDITENKEMYYLSEKKLVEKAIKYIERVLKLCTFDGWKNPEQRHNDILKLLEKLKERHNQKHRYTTLGEKNKKRQEEA